MTTVIDLAGTRRRLLRIALERSYGYLAPPTAIAMADDLRRWLWRWAHTHAWDHAQLQGSIEKHEAGVAATLDGAMHDPDAQHLLAPEILLLLLALEVDPHNLRARWPPNHDVRGVLALADLFGRPYS